MADNNPTPMTNRDITPPTGTSFEPAAPLKTSGTDSHPAGAGTAAAKGRTEQAKQTIREGAGKVSQQATEKLRVFADDGKERGAGALEQLSRMLTDAAGQVDDKLGGQYGEYARNAAGQVQGLANTVRDTDVDQLLDSARSFVRSSPAVAIGVAAAVGFAAARLVQAGVDAAPADQNTTRP